MSAENKALARRYFEEVWNLQKPVAAVFAIGLAWMMMSAPSGQSQNGGNDDESKIQRGFAIAVDRTGGMASKRCSHE